MAPHLDAKVSVFTLFLHSAGKKNWIQNEVVDDYDVRIVGLEMMLMRLQLLPLVTRCRPTPPIIEKLTYEAFCKSCFSNFYFE